MLSRPAEVVTAGVGSAVGALLGILIAFGVTIPAGVTAPIVTLVSWIAALVTWIVGSKQRAGALASSHDGTVQTGGSGQ